MSLLSRMSDDLASKLFDTENGLAVQAQYLPGAGGSLNILILIERGGVLDDSNWKVAVETEAIVRIRQADVSEPSYKDKIIIDGETWTVVGVHGPNAGIWKLEIRKDLRPTFKAQL